MKTTNLKRLSIYLLSFGLGRGALFIAPLLLANFLYGAEYGALETALAAASVWAGVASLGTASVVPLVLLRKNTQATMQGIVAQHLLVVSAAGCIALACGVLELPLVWKLTALLTGSLAMQGLVSTELKTLGHGDASVLIDAGLLGVMAAAVVCAHFVEAARPIVFALWAALAYCLVLVLIYLRILTQHGGVLGFLAWRATLKVGIPLMLGGLVTLLATTSGRLGMGLLASSELTAEYAVLVRAGALPIIAHQLITIAKFRNLFAQSNSIVEREILQILLLVGVSVLGFFVVIPWLDFLLGHAFTNALAQYRMAGFLIAAQSILWSGIALNDLIIARHEIMHKALPYLMVNLATLLGAGWLVIVGSEVKVEMFVIAHSCVMLCYYFSQSLVMNFFGLRLARVWLTAVALYLASVVIGYLISFLY